MIQDEIRMAHKATRSKVGQGRARELAREDPQDFKVLRPERKKDPQNAFYVTCKEV